MQLSRLRTTSARPAPHGLVEVSADRYWKMMFRVAVLGVLCHCVFLVIFAVSGLRVLAEVNLGSITCYGLILWATTRRMNFLVIFLTAGELLAHTAVAVWTLGWDSNFQYYLLLVVPFVVQAESSRTRKVGGSIVAMTTFLTLTAWLGGAAPHAAVSPQLLDVLRILNSVNYLGLLCYLTFFYVNAVDEAETLLRRTAERDLMTGLLNRSSFLERAERWIGDHDSLDAACWVVFVDIDHFKTVNDRYGHAAGDAAIRLVADRISSAVRQGDLVARWGGEEFLVLLADASESTARDVAERLRSSVAAAPASASLVRSLSVTVGVARHPDGAPLDMTIRRADAALYRGKEAGRDRVEVAA